jgi:hypothetical protein
MYTSIEMVMIINAEMEGMWEEPWMQAGVGANQTFPAPIFKKMQFNI